MNGKELENSLAFFTQLAQDYAKSLEGQGHQAAAFLLLSNATAHVKTVRALFEQQRVALAEAEGKLPKPENLSELKPKQEK